MTEIRPNIHWVGIVEWSLSHFHGHELSIRHGTSYNSYLIMDEKITLVDGVKGTHTEEFIKGIEKHVPLEKIDYLVVNHSEPDHTGALPALLAKNPNVTIIVSKNGSTSFKRHYPGNWNLQVVKPEETISLGKRSLRFFEAPMLHWPDSMFTYCPEEKLLFSNDAFGQHYAASTRFADEADQDELWQEAIKYFANILTPFSGQVTRKVNDLLGLGWPIGMICPSHGLIWRNDPTTIVKKYLEWASGKAATSAVVVFDTIWGGTEKMARAICRGIEAEGVSYRLFGAGTSDFNDVMTEVLKARGLVIGSPTLNNGIMPTLAPYIEEIRHLRFQQKLGAAFGTYGWSGENVKIIEEAMQNGGFKIAQVGIRSQFSPHDEDLLHCETFGRGFAKILRAI